MKFYLPSLAGWAAIVASVALAELVGSLTEGWWFYLTLGLTGCAGFYAQQTTPRSQARRTP